MIFSQDALKRIESNVSNIVVDAGQIIQEHWEESREVHFKAREERVTQFDKKIEDVLREKLAHILPEAGDFVEEGESSGIKEYMWSIDPIDGTNNFIGHIPLFYIQVALVYKGVPIVGVLYNPISRQLFSASKNNGAQYNNHLLVAKTTTSLERAIVDIDFGAHNNGLYWKLPIFKVLCENCHRVRSSGGMYGAYIAFGGVDGYLVLNETTKIVDQMPRVIWMEELGLTVEQFSLNGHKIILSSNSVLFPQLKQLIVATGT